MMASRIAVCVIVLTVVLDTKGESPVRPQFDSQDEEILNQRRAEYDQVQGARVGDFLRTKTGLLRFTHDWGDTIQTTVRPSHPCNGDASFYLGNDGHVSFSGSLDPGIQKDKLRDTGEVQSGGFWFFHHNRFEASNGVQCVVPCRVFERVD